MLPTRWIPALLATLIAAVGPTAFASGGVPLTPTQDFDVDRFDASTNETFGESVTGDFNRDWMTDIVFIRGGKLRLSIGSALFGHTMRVTDALDEEVDSNAVAVLPAQLPGTGDWFVSAGSAGLVAWQRDSDLEMFVSQSLGDTEWIGARSLAVADVDADGWPDVVGLMQDGLTVRILSGPLSPEPSESAFGLPIAADGVLALDVDGVAGMEIAVRTSMGIGVFGSEGSFLYGYETDEPCPAFAVVKIGSSTAELLAWIYVGDYVIVESYGTIVGAIYLGDLDVSGLAGSDVNGDGDTDLVIGHRSDSHLVYLSNVGAAPYFINDSANASLLVYGENLSTAGNSATPVIADLDGDGNADIAFPVQAEESVALFVNAPVAFGGGDRPIMEASWAHYGDTDTGVTHGYLFTPIKDDLQGRPTPNAELEVAVYLQPDPQSPVNPIPIQATTYATLLAGGYPHFVKRPTTETVNSLYWVMARYVDPVAKRTYPHVLLGFTTHIPDPNSSNNSNYLEALAGSFSALVGVEEPVGPGTMAVSYSGVTSITPAQWLEIKRPGQGGQPFDVGTITPLPDLPDIPELPDPRTK